MDLPEYLGLFCWVSWLCFHDGWENWKITRGSTAGPEGRSGGRSEARSAERRPERSPEGPAVPPRGVSIYFIISFHEYHHRVVSIYFIFSFHEYHQHPPGFNFFFSSFMNTTNGFQVLWPKIFVNTAKNFKKIMKSRSQNKKNMRGFYWNLSLVIFRTRIQL